MVQPNKELGYAHFLHVVPPEEIRTVMVMGDLEVTYIGFVEERESESSCLSVPPAMCSLFQGRT